MLHNDMTTPTDRGSKWPIVYQSLTVPATADPAFLNTAASLVTYREANQIDAAVTQVEEIRRSAQQWFSRCRQQVSEFGRFDGDPALCLERRGPDRFRLPGV